MTSSPVPESGRAPLVQLSGVSKSYGGVTAVSGVDLEIARGEFVAIMGPVSYTHLTLPTILLV